MNQEVYWYTQKEIEYLPKLNGNDQAEFVIIGGGMAGLSAAERLRTEGRSVILLEKYFCGGGASGKSSGFITPDSEIELSALLHHHGEQEAKKIWEFVVSGVEIIRKSIIDKHIQCDYQVQDSLFLANNFFGQKEVRKEHEARQSISYESTLHDSQSLKNIIGSQQYVGGVQYADTFGINSFLYCQAMKDFLVNTGVTIYEKTAAQSITEGLVTTEEGSVAADHIIVCTDRYIPEFQRMKKEIYHIQTFLGISQPLSHSQIKSIFPKNKMMVWDTDLIYNYFRCVGDNRLLIGGGDVLYTYTHSLTKNTERFKRRLTHYIKTKFPSLPIKLEYVWPGMLGVSKDFLPIMGFDENSKNIWFVGAATGLPWAAALGHYAAEKFLSGRNEFDERFSPKRNFIIGKRMQKLLTTKPTYAISHWFAKYFS